MTLYDHTAHPHTPRNVNALHRAEQQAARFNERLAVTLTRAVGTMYCAYAFILLAIIGFPGPGASLAVYVQWLSQCFIQLVMLSVIMVGQSVQGRHQEIQADEAYHIALKNEHEIAEIAAHLAAQDDELTKQTAMIARLSDEKSALP